MTVRYVGCLFFQQLKLLAFLSLDELEEDLRWMVGHGFQGNVFVVERFEYRLEKRLHPDWREIVGNIYRANHGFYDVGQNLPKTPIQQK